MKHFLKQKKYRFFVLFLLLSLVFTGTLFTKPVTTQTETRKATTLALGKPVTYLYKDLMTEYGKPVTFVYTFTPKKTGNYEFRTNGDFSPSVYDKDNNWVDYTSDSDRLYYHLEKGNTYTAYLYLDYDYYKNHSAGVEIGVYGTSNISFSDDLEDAKITTTTVGTKKQLAINDRESIKSATWKSSDKSILSVSKDGTIHAKKKGYATVSVVGKDIWGNTFADSLTIAVSNPKLSRKSVTLMISGKKDSSGYYDCDHNTISLKGLTDDSSVTVTSSDNQLATSYYPEKKVIELLPKKTGNYKVTVAVDGTNIPVKVSTTDVHFKRNSKTVGDAAGTTWSKTVTSSSMMALSKGETAVLSLENVKKSDKVTYKSSNTSVATVSKSGKVTAKGKGYAKISATVNGAKLTYSVGVSNKKSIQALRLAAKNLGKDYDLKKKYQKKGRRIYSYKDTVSMSKLLPGDIILETDKKGTVKAAYIYEGNQKAIGTKGEKTYSKKEKQLIVRRFTTKSTKKTSKKSSKKVSKKSSKKNSRS